MLQNKTQVDGSDSPGPASALDGVVTRDGTTPMAALRRIAELEREVAQLKEALEHRRMYGLVTGVVAVRLGMTPEQAWALLVRLSQQSNQKMQVVARVLHDASFDRLRPEDRGLAAGLDAELRGRLSLFGSD